jgi:hypothetical protein
LNNKNNCEYNIPYLEFLCNKKPCGFSIKNAKTTFKETADYIKNIKGNLNNFEVIEDINISFSENINDLNDLNEIDSERIQNNVSLFIEKAKEKYEIITIHFSKTECFDDIEVYNLISIIDCDNYKSVRESIFSKEITHLYVNTKKISENKRIIYYIFDEKK